MNTEEKLAWIDVETTGLDPYPPSCDQLLEVACLITDTDLNLLDDGFHATVWFDTQAAELMRHNAAPVVRQMHDRTGLWQRLTSLGTPKEQVEADLLAYITSHIPQARHGLLAGNSVALDKAFLTVHLPKVANHLHYRVIDVSTVANLARWWAQIDTTSSKNLKHEAMADIQESVDQLRKLRTALSLTNQQSAG